MQYRQYVTFFKTRKSYFEKKHKSRWVTNKVISLLNYAQIVYCCIVLLSYQWNRKQLVHLSCRNFLFTGFSFLPCSSKWKCPVLPSPLSLQLLVTSLVGGSINRLETRSKCVPKVKQYGGHFGDFWDPFWWWTLPVLTRYHTVLVYTTCGKS